MKSRLALALFAVLAVAGCSSGSSGGGSTAPPTIPATGTTASPSASATPTGSPSPTPTPSFSSTVKATGPCTGKDLSVSVGQEQGSAGHSELPIVFTNVGSAGCTLFGDPGASFVDASGAEVGPQAVFVTQQEATVTLAPNGTANAILSIPDPGVFSPSQCQAKSVSRLRVYPPGVRNPSFVNVTEMICTTKNPYAAMSVTPVTPGPGN